MMSPKKMSTRPNAPQQPPVVPSRGNAGINAQTPLLLLPVHIQTRFVDSSAVNVLAARQSASELLVRIYPDQIAVNSHEPELTSQEVADGQAYWNALWQVGTAPTNTDDLKAPWRVLASLYGSPRAAWIARALTPTNLSAQPVAVTPAGSTPVPAPVFPSVTLRDSSWEKAATADALPDAWTIVLISSGQTSLYRGSPIVPRSPST